MDHPMAVRAEQGKVSQSGPSFSCDVQRDAMVAFDLIESMGAVLMAEVEGAYFASYRKAAPFGIRDLLTTELRITFTAKMSTESNTAFPGRGVIHIKIHRDASLPVSKQFPDTRSRRMHLSSVSTE